MYRIGLLLAAMLMPTAAMAHDSADNPPGEHMDAWHLLGANDQGDGLAYVAFYTRAGNATSLEILEVLREPDRLGDDQLHSHVVADCATNQFEFTVMRGFRNNLPSPPRVIFTLTSGLFAPPATMIGRALDYVCRGRAAPVEEPTQPE